MTIETSTYIADWNSALPANTDSKSEGDDHIRKIKTDLQATLPGFAGRFRRIQTKSGAYTAVLNDNSSILRTSGTWTLSLTAVSTLGNGWEVLVYNDGSGTITVDPSGAELINGASTLTIAASTWACIWCDGSAFRAIGGRTDSINTATTDTAQTFTAAKTFSANPTITGNAIFIQPPNNASNVHVWLRDESSTNQGLLFWDRSNDAVKLRRYNSAGSASEGEITIGASGGVMIDAPTGGDKGAGTVNAASGVYDGGYRLAPVLIESKTASASASLDFISGIGSSFLAYELVLSNVIPTNNDVTLLIRVTTDGGATWISTGDYVNAILIFGNDGVSRNYAGATDTGVFLTSNTAGAGTASNLTNGGWCGSVKFYRPASTAHRKYFVVSGIFLGETGATDYINSVNGGGTYNLTSPINGVRVVYSAGTIASGDVDLYGIRG